MPRRRIPRWLAVGGAGITTLLSSLLWLFAAAASAHSTLISTDPSAGSTVNEPPSAIVLTFNEDVTLVRDGLRLLDSSGKRLSLHAVGHPQGTASKVSADVPELGDGTYVVSWRVISADGHPVRGAFLFTVAKSAVGSSSNAAAARAVAERELTRSGGDRPVGVLAGLLRFATFALLALLGGGLVFLAFVWEPLAQDTSGVSATDDARARHWLRWLWRAAVVVTVAGLLVGSVYTAGQGFASLFDVTSLKDYLRTRGGEMFLARLAILATAGWLGLRRLVDKRIVVLALLAGAASLSFASHAATGHQHALALAADVVHLVAMSAWLGGLAFLATRFLRRSSAHTVNATATADGGDDEQIVDVAWRFSRMAFWCVIAIVATGVYQSWRQVGSFSSLGNDYGHFLIIKVALVALLVGAAAVSRTVLYQRLREPDEELVAVGAGGTSDPGGGSAGGHEDRHRDDHDDDAAFEPVDVATALRRPVLVEAVIAVAILVVTALLVDAAPPRGSNNQPFTTSIVKNGEIVQLVVDPARRSTANVLHLYVTRTDGTFQQVIAATASLTLPAKDVGPINVPLARAGPAHFTNERFTIPYTGTWRLDVTAQTSEFDEVAVSSTFTVS